MVVTCPGPYDNLDINVERGERIGLAQIEALEDLLQRKLKDALEFTARVALDPVRSIPRTEMDKTARVVR